MKRHFTISGLIPLLLVFLLVQSCDRNQNLLGEDPYAGGRDPLGIVFERLNRPLPAVRPNDQFEVSVRGLQRHEGNVQVFINEEQAQVVALTDSTMEVRVPEMVSTGGLTVRINNQIFFGPMVRIEGSAAFDTDYGIRNGFNGGVNYILPDGNNFWMLGNFTNFENQASETVFRRGIHRVNNLGSTVALSDSTKGALGGISSMVRMPDGKFIVGGGLYMMENINDMLFNVSRITRVKSDGLIDSRSVELINTTPERPEMAFDTLPAFNAYLISDFTSGSGGTINGLFAMPDTSVIVVGNFGLHQYIDYTYSSRSSKMMVTTRARHIVRIKENGRVDSTFGYDNAGANGFINGAIETNDGKIVIAGNFTSFNNVSANRIVAFNKDGSINTAFGASIGIGANDEIYSITYNKNLGKIALAGRFTTFNGQAKPGVVLLNDNGSIDDVFTLGDLEHRIPNYAYVMSSGRVLVTGNFIRYNGIKRSNMLILESNGDALQRYNNLGDFMGTVNHVIETTSSMGHPALLIGGFFQVADGRNVGNIFRLEVRD